MFLWSKRTGMKGCCSNVIDSTLHANTHPAHVTYENDLALTNTRTISRCFKPTQMKMAKMM